MNIPHAPDIVIEDVRFLIAAREDPERIAHRLGYNRQSLGRALHRWGENDLAAVFGRVGTAVRH